MPKNISLPQLQNKASDTQGNMGLQQDCATFHIIQPVTAFLWQSYGNSFILQFNDIPRLL
jgi:hypothetical protein